MKYFVLFAAFMAIVALSSLAQAYPQKLPVPIPPPTNPPVAAFHNSVATNPKGGQDVSVKLAATNLEGNTKGGNVVRGATVGVQGHGLGASVTKSQNGIAESFRKQAEANLRLGDSGTLIGKVSHQTDTKIKGIDFKPQLTSSSLAWQGDKLGAAISRDIDRGVSDTLTKSVSANLFRNDNHNLDATVFRSNVLQDNGFKFQKTGGMLDYHANGHGLNAGLTRFSGIGNQANVGGYSTLFRSNDGLTTLKANAGGSQWLSGPFSNQRDYSFGLGLSHNAWRG
ncbi:hypothetical protein DOY81_008037 [Sarcophaga bullata]|nr:hypothetical protein DOY81_008037 [Sarcophaga bullata]